MKSHGRAGLHGRRVAQLAFGKAAVRRATLRRYIFRALERATPIVASDEGGIRYFLSTADKVIGPEVFSTGSYDAAMIAMVVSLVGELSTNPSPLENRTFVDVGANIGTSTLPAVRNFGARRAVAFEPSPQSFQLLRCNIIANGLEDRVVAYNVAISDHVGSMQLAQSDSNSGDNRLLPGQGTVGGPEFSVVEVPVTTLDAAMEAASVKPDEVGLVWVDTQGHEAAVLAGGERFLAASPPTVIEYWPYGLRQSGQLNRLHELLSDRYSHVIDVRATADAGTVVRLTTRDLTELEERYHSSEYTDLILVK